MLTRILLLISLVLLLCLLSLSCLQLPIVFDKGKFGMIHLDEYICATIPLQLEDDAMWPKPFTVKVVSRWLAWSFSTPFESCATGSVEDLGARGV